MKKILALTLGMVFLSGIVFAVNFNIGIEILSGRMFYPEIAARFTGAGFDKLVDGQGEEDMSFTNLAIRISKTKPVLMEDLSAGIEIGMSMPLSGFEKTFEMPALDATQVGKFVPILGTPSQDYKMEIKKEIKAALFPVLAKFAYKIPGEKMDINIGLGFGAYGLLTLIKTTTKTTYVLDTAPYKKGDVAENIATEFTPEITFGGDLTIGAIYKLSEKLSIGLNGKLGYLMKPFEGDENKGYTVISGLYQDEDFETIKEGAEIGGINFGGEISLNLSF